MGTIGAGMLAPLTRFSLNYAEKLLIGVEPSRFARQPAGVMTNHPAFVFGHLAIYPDKLLMLLGRPELARPDQKFLDLFEAGKECIDDPDGTIYPSMDAIVSQFRSRHEALLTPLAETTDEVFARANPNERSRERFPTIGAAASFYISGHAMMHLGQISAWRRCVGLPSALG